MKSSGRPTLCNRCVPQKPPSPPPQTSPPKRPFVTCHIRIGCFLLMKGKELRRWKKTKFGCNHGDSFFENYEGWTDCSHSLPPRRCPWTGDELSTNISPLRPEGNAFLRTIKKFCYSLLDAANARIFQVTKRHKSPSLQR